jgi:hypothetical protein
MSFMSILKPFLILTYPEVISCSISLLWTIVITIIVIIITTRQTAYWPESYHFVLFNMTHPSCYYHRHNHQNLELKPITWLTLSLPLWLSYFPIQSKTKECQGSRLDYLSGNVWEYCSMKSTRHHRQIKVRAILHTWDASGITTQSRYDLRGLSVFPFLAKGYACGQSVRTRN